MVDENGREYPTGGDPKDFCICGHHEMNHASYANMPRACNQTTCGCNSYTHVDSEREHRSGEQAAGNMQGGGIPPTHYVLLQGPNPFVKTAQFFREQGGLTAEWGKKWVPVTISGDPSREDIIAVAEFRGVVSEARQASVPAPQSEPPSQQTELLERMAEALQEFVDRCDRGEVRSRRTYAKFKEILAEYEATK